MIYIVNNERKHRQSRTIVVFTDYVWKQKRLLYRWTMSVPKHCVWNTVRSHLWQTNFHWLEF